MSWIETIHWRYQFSTETSKEKTRVGLRPYRNEVMFKDLTNVRLRHCIYKTGRACNISFPHALSTLMYVGFCGQIAAYYSFLFIRRICLASILEKSCRLTWTFRVCLKHLTCNSLFQILTLYPFCMCTFHGWMDKTFRIPYFCQHKLVEGYRYKCTAGH